MPVQLIDARLPDFGVPAARRELSRSIYAGRLDALLRARRAAGLDAIVIYADREHSANLAWLTGFDPDREEALLILAAGAIPTLLAGPENLGRVGQATIEVQARLYPPFGRLGQDRSQTPDLEEVLASAGIESGYRIGMMGWKYFGVHEARKPENWFETPAYIVDTLRRIVGTEGRVVNANALTMDANTGLRAINEVEQIALFEFAAVMASEGLKALFQNIKPGVSDIAAARQMGLGPLSHPSHVMLSTDGRRTGFDDPSGRIVERGDPVTATVGYRGGLSSRISWVAADGSDLPSNAADWLEKLAMPYFACAAEWYEAIGIGVAGGALDAIARKHLGGPFFNLILNPGHLIHLDGWMNTPIYPGSREVLRSGQAIQCNIVLAVGLPYHGASVEDGIALLDEQRRNELRDKFPEVAARVEARRAFMADVLGIRLKPEVMPLSNLAAAYPPFLLSPDQLMAIR